MQINGLDQNAFSAANAVNADHMITSIMEHVLMEIDYYQQLLQTLEQERDILLKGLHDELVANCERKLELSEQLADTQKRRQAMVGTFNTEDLTISKLSQLTPLVAEHERQRFRESLQEADTLSQRLRQLNELNRAYINEALDTIGQILNIVSGQQAAGYTANGSRAPIKGRRLLAREV